MISCKGQGLPTSDPYFVLTKDTFSINGPQSITRNILQDKKGAMWFASWEGIVSYDGKIFTTVTNKDNAFDVWSIIEDKKGNIWTSSESDSSRAWVLSRYDGKTLSDKKPTVTQLTNKPMFFGILEAIDGSIWFGALDGVYRYDGNTITDFKDKAVQK